MKVNKTSLKKMVGRKLAARVLKTWIEDFVDEDTGEVVSIERNEVVIDRETVIEPEHVDIILESGVQNILVHKEEPNQSDYSIIYNTLQKDRVTRKKKLYSTSIASCVMQTLLMMPVHARLSITFSSLKRDMIWEMLVVIESIRN